LLEIRVLTMILEGDSKIVIKSLENEEESLVSYGHLISGAKLIIESFMFY